EGDTEAPAPETTPDAEDEARASYGGFLRFVWRSPLLFWVTVTTLLFVVCRWMLNYQYSAFFGAYFSDDDELAEFLGAYTQIAMVVAILLQILVVNHLIAWLGLKGAHLIYSVLLLGGMLLCLG